MADSQAPPLTVLRPGEGRAGDLGGIGVVFKLWGQDPRTHDRGHQPGRL
jgi:hypothetical protein